MAQQRLDALAVGGPAGLADAGADARGDVADRERVVEDGAHALRGGGDLVRGADVREDDGELVAAESRDGVLRAHHAREPRGSLLQQRVADVVAVDVVDLLEAVEVDEQQSDMGLAARVV